MRKNYLVMLIWSFALLTRNNYADPSNRLIEVLIQIESSGNLRAIGDKERDHKAYGPLQVRKYVCDDINQRYHTKYRAKDCLGNLPLSIKIFKRYVMMWGTKKRLGHNPTDEDYARIWNGGPNGWNRDVTLSYVAKVRQLGGLSNDLLAQR